MILSRRADLEAFLRNPSSARAVLFYGRDRGVVRDRADVVARSATEDPEDPFNVAILTDVDLDADPARLPDELSAQSLLGGRRLVRVRLSAEKVSLERLVGEALAGHAEGAFNPDATLVVEAGALGRDSPLRKSAEKAPAAICAPCYEDEPQDVARLVRETLAKDNVGLTSDALDLFVARLPRERGVARQEIERLALYVGAGGGANADDLQAFFGVEPDASLADAAQDAFGGRFASAFAHLRRAAAEGEGGPAAVRAVTGHLARLRKIATLASTGAGLPEAAKSAGVFWKNEREVIRQARAWSLKELDALQPDVFAADRACKQSGAPSALLAERLVMSIAARARRLGL